VRLALEGSDIRTPGVHVSPQVAQDPRHLPLCRVLLAGHAGDAHQSLEHLHEPVAIQVLGKPLDQFHGVPVLSKTAKPSPVSWGPSRPFPERA
jgi:hypothetical protein